MGLNFGRGCGILWAMKNNKEKLTLGRRKKVAAVLNDIMAHLEISPSAQVSHGLRRKRYALSGTIGQNINIEGALTHEEEMEQVELCLKYCDPDNNVNRSICSLWMKGRIDEQKASHVAIFSPILPEIKLPKTPGLSVVPAPDQSPDNLVDRIYQAVADSKQQVLELEKLAVNRQRVAALLKLVESNHINLGKGDFSGKIGADVTYAGRQYSDHRHKRVNVDLMYHGDYFGSIGFRQEKINQLWLCSAQYQDDGWHTKIQEESNHFVVFHTRDENPNTAVEEICDVVVRSMHKTDHTTPKLRRFNFPWHKTNGREK